MVNVTLNGTILAFVGLTNSYFHTSSKVNKKTHSLYCEVLRRNLYGKQILPVYIKAMQDGDEEFLALIDVVLAKNPFVAWGLLGGKTEHRTILEALKAVKTEGYLSIGAVLRELEHLLPESPLLKAWEANLRRSDKTEFRNKVVLPYLNQMRKEDRPTFFAYRSAWTNLAEITQAVARLAAQTGLNRHESWADLQVTPAYAPGGETPEMVKKLKDEVPFPTQHSLVRIDKFVNHHIMFEIETPLEELDAMELAFTSKELKFKSLNKMPLPCNNNRTAPLIPLLLPFIKHYNSASVDALQYNLNSWLLLFGQRTSTTSAPTSAMHVGLLVYPNLPYRIVEQAEDKFGQRLISPKAKADWMVKQKGKFIMEETEWQRWEDAKHFFPRPSNAPLPPPAEQKFAFTTNTLGGGGYKPNMMTAFSSRRGQLEAEKRLVGWNPITHYVNPLKKPRGPLIKLALEESDPKTLDAEALHKALNDKIEWKAKHFKTPYWEIPLKSLNEAKEALFGSGDLPALPKLEGFEETVNGKTRHFVNPSLEQKQFEALPSHLVKGALLRINKDFLNLGLTNFLPGISPRSPDAILPLQKALRSQTYGNSQAAVFNLDVKNCFPAIDPKHPNLPARLAKSDDLIRNTWNRPEDADLLKTILNEYFLTAGFDESNPLYQFTTPQQGLPTGLPLTPFFWLYLALPLAHHLEVHRQKKNIVAWNLCGDDLIGIAKRNLTDEVRDDILKPWFEFANDLDLNFHFFKNYKEKTGLAQLAPQALRESQSPWVLKFPRQTPLYHAGVAITRDRVVATPNLREYWEEGVHRNPAFIQLAAQRGTKGQALLPSPVLRLLQRESLSVNSKPESLTNGGSISSVPSLKTLLEAPLIAAPVLFYNTYKRKSLYHDPVTDINTPLLSLLQPWVPRKRLVEEDRPLRLLSREQLVEEWKNVEATVRGVQKETKVREVIWEWFQRIRDEEEGTRDEQKRAQEVEINKHDVRPWLSQTTEMLLTHKEHLLGETSMCRFLATINLVWNTHKAWPEHSYAFLPAFLFHLHNPGLHSRHYLKTLVPALEVCEPLAPAIHVYIPDLESEEAPRVSLGGLDPVSMSPYDAVTAPLVRLGTYLEAKEGRTGRTSLESFEPSTIQRLEDELKRWQRSSGIGSKSALKDNLVRLHTSLVRSSVDKGTAVFSSPDDSPLPGPGTHKQLQQVSDFIKLRSAQAFAERETESKRLGNYLRRGSLRGPAASATLRSSASLASHCFFQKHTHIIIIKIKIKIKISNDYSNEENNEDLLPSFLAFTKEKNEDFPSSPCFAKEPSLAEPEPAANAAAPEQANKTVPLLADTALGLEPTNETNAATAAPVSSLVVSKEETKTAVLNSSKAKTHGFSRFTFPELADAATAASANTDAGLAKEGKAKQGIPVKLDSSQNTGSLRSLGVLAKTGKAEERTLGVLPKSGTPDDLAETGSLRSLGVLPEEDKKNGEENTKLSYYQNNWGLRPNCVLAKRIEQFENPETKKLNAEDFEKLRYALVHDRNGWLRPLHVLLRAGFVVPSSGIYWETLQDPSNGSLRSQHIRNKAYHEQRIANAQASAVSSSQNTGSLRSLDVLAKTDKAKSSLAKDRTLGKAKSLVKASHSTKQKKERTQPALNQLIALRAKTARLRKKPRSSSNQSRWGGLVDYKRTT